MWEEDGRVEGFMSGRDEVLMSMSMADNRSSWRVSAHGALDQFSVRAQKEALRLTRGHLEHGHVTVTVVVIPASTQRSP